MKGIRLSSPAIAKPPHSGDRSPQPAPMVMPPGPEPKANPAVISDAWVVLTSGPGDAASMSLVTGFARIPGVLAQVAKRPRRTRSGQGAEFR